MCGKRIISNIKPLYMHWSSLSALFTLKALIACYTCCHASHNISFFPKQKIFGIHADLLVFLKGPTEWRRRRDRSRGTRRTGIESSDGVVGKLFFPKKVSPHMLFKKHTLRQNTVLGTVVKCALSPLSKRALGQSLLAFSVKYHRSISPQSKRVFLDITQKIARGCL